MVSRDVISAFRFGDTRLRQRDGGDRFEGSRGSAALLSVEGRRQRQNVEKVKLVVMPSPGQSPKRISDENEFELKEEAEESFV